MAKLDWDKTGERLYETGVSHGVLYLPETSGTNIGQYLTGVAWNGLTSVSENPTGGEPEAIYADNIKYLNLSSAEDLEGSIEAYTYPDEWAECDGSAVVSTGLFIGQQNRRTFGLCYRTEVGSDTKGTEHGYKLHLIYGALASPSEKTYQTINDSPEAISFSWDYSTTPVNVTGRKSTAILTIDSTKFPPTTSQGTTTPNAKLAALEGALYGTDSADPWLPLPDDIITLFSGTSNTLTRPTT